MTSLEDLDNIAAWLKHDLQNTPQRLEDEKQVIAKYGQLFRLDNIDNITKEQFESFLDFRENRHWTIHRQKTALTKDMARLKNSLKILLNENLSLEERLRRLKDKESQDYQDNLGRAVFSAILLVAHPDKYPIYNEAVDHAFEKLNIEIVNKNEPIWKQYPEVQEIILNLAAKYELSLWQIDWIWWRVLEGLTFDELVAFLKETRMQENYQAVVIKSLIENNGRASKQELEQKLREYNPSSTSKSMVDTVLSVLKSHKIIWKGYEDEYILNVVRLLDAKQEENLLSLCDSRINEFANSNLARRYWKIAPGQEASYWEEQRENGVIAIGWNEVGDLSKIDKIDLEKKIAELWPDSANSTASQFRNFLSIKEGDIIVANRGLERVVGIGRVSGPYKYREDLNFRHTYPVEWFDTNERTIPRQEGVWRKTVAPISEEFYNTITGTTDRNYLLVRHNPDFKRVKTDREYWQDILGKEYHYGRNVANYTKVIPGSKMIWFYSDSNDLYLWGHGDVSAVDAAGDGKFIAKISSFASFNGGSAVKAEQEVQSKIKSLPGWNPYNSIIEIDKETFDLVTAQENKRQMTKQELIEMTGLTEQRVDEISDLLAEKHQVIFYGPPGTGKTFVAKTFAKYFTGSEIAIKMVQLHPSYSYEDFVEGIRPNISDDGSSNGFSKQWGILRRMVKECNDNPQQKHILIIDEINRGNISKVFGELIFLLEYRNEKVSLAYSPKEEFALPSNLYIIGTMNSADRSIAYIDYALRRRFYFIGFYPDYSVLEKWYSTYPAKVDIRRIIGVLKSVNDSISEKFGQEYQIGHSYFMVKDLNDISLRRIIEYSVKPLLEQYFYGKKNDIEKMVSDCEQMFSK